jgi:peptidoglycan hydrolase CwlO-like protein
MDPAPGHPPVASLRVRLAWLVSMVLAVLVVAPNAEAASIATLQARVDNARTEARNLASALQLRTAELQADQQKAAVAARRQQILEGVLARNVARARALEARVTAAQERLVKAQARFHRAQRVLSRRLVAIYKSDAPDLTTVLLEADGFSDLLTRTEYIQQINDADTVLVNRVQALRNQVRSALARVRAARAQAAQRASLSTLRSRMAGWQQQVTELQAAMGTPGSPAGAVQQWFDGFAIPKNIVMCESGGDYGALNPSSGAGGAYQMLPSTYEGLGGKHEAPHLAPKSEQDRLAAKLWADGQGRGNWEC